MAKKKNQARRPFSRLIGKIGWCSGPTLGLDTGHFVFIRRVKNNGKCDVNTLTSIKSRRGGYEIGKIRMIENGALYPIPKKDDSLPRFGGIDKRIIHDIPLSKIEQIGRHSIKRRHHHYIQKYMK